MGIQALADLPNKPERIKKFFNKMQREAMIVSAHNEYYVCARGTGKSEGLDARFIIRNVWAMPGSTGALISPSYVKAWANTLPAICHALAQWGYIQNVHYYVGRKAPKTAKFAMPKREPLRDAWGNCLHFWNGTILVILSLTSGMSANSMSIDWIIGPEAKFLNYEKIKSEINPANRGNLQYFDNCAWHHSEMYTTDMPTSRSGKWILDKENDMIPEHIKLIKALYRAKQEYINACKEKKPLTYNRTLALLENDLNTARKFQPSKDKMKAREYTTFYGEYDIFDNLEVVGEDYIWQMKRELPPLMFRTAILNERLFKVANGFYSALDDKIHFYQPPEKRNYAADDLFGDNKINYGCLVDGDYDESKPLHIAFDANSAISSACVGQVDADRQNLKTLKSFFVKTPRKLPELVQDICDYYSMAGNKNVIFYFDHTFVWTTATTAESYRDTIIRVFRQNKWNLTDVYIGHQPSYKFRHSQIDMALKGVSGLLFPTFNEINNEYLKLAMERTGIRMGKTGFEKDKTDERLTDSPNNPDETKTHITDAWDTLFVGCNFYRPGNNIDSSLTSFDFI